MIAFLRIHAKAVLHCFGGMDIEEGKPITEDFLCVSVLNEPDKDSFPDQIPLSFFQKHRADIIQLLPGDGRYFPLTARYSQPLDQLRTVTG